MKRYNQVRNGSYEPRSEMVEERDGDWVWYEDCEAMQSKCAEMQSKCAELEAKCAELLEACEAALSMFDKMTDSKGPYKYIDGTGLVSDAYDISRLLKQAIAKAEGEAE